MENLRNYIDKRIDSIKSSISKSESRLHDANKAETELIARRGWGYGMRNSKIGFSTAKSDRIKERIEMLTSDLDKMKKALYCVKVITEKRMPIPTTCSEVIKDIRNMAIISHRQTFTIEGDKCCLVCDCCEFSKSFIEKLDNLCRLQINHYNQEKYEK